MAESPRPTREQVDAAEKYGRHLAESWAKYGGGVKLAHLLAEYGTLAAEVRALRAELDTANRAVDDHLAQANRSARALDMRNRSLDRAWAALPEGLDASDDSLAAHIRAALAARTPQPEADEREHRRRAVESAAAALVESWGPRAAQGYGKGRGLYDAVQMLRRHMSDPAGSVAPEPTPPLAPLVAVQAVVEAARAWTYNRAGDDPDEGYALDAAVRKLDAAPQPAVPDGEDGLSPAPSRREPCQCGHARRDHQGHEDGDGDCETEDGGCAVYEARGRE